MLRASLLVFSVLLSTGLDCASTSAPTTVQTTVTTVAPTTPEPFEKRYKPSKPSNHVFPGFEKPKTPAPFANFTFVHATDPQFGLIEYFKSGKTEQNVWDEEEKSLADAVQQWNDMKPKFVIITGDLVNAFPIASERLNRTNQMASLTSELNKLDKSIPLLLLPGNHDLTDDMENQPNAAAIKEYNDMFGDNYYSFWVDNVKFIVLETQYFKNHTNKEIQRRYEEQNKWIDDQIRDIQDKNSHYTHVVVFQHIPWFLVSIDHTSPDTDWARISQDEAEPILNKLEAAGIHHIFCGHYHQNVEEHYKNITMHVTSAIGWQAKPDTTRAGYNFVQVTQDEIISEYRNIHAPEPVTTEPPTKKNSSSALIACTSVFVILNLFVALFSL